MTVHELYPERAKHGEALPINIEAEQAVLGAMLIHAGAIEAVASVLQPQHFSEEIHRRIYSVVLAMFAEGKPATPRTLKTYLGDHDLGGVSTSQYLARLAAEALPPMMALGMAKEIRDLAARRELIAIGEGLASSARTSGPGESAAELAAASIAGLQHVTEIAIDGDTRRDPGACAAVMVERARAIMNGEQRDAGVSTGIPDLDRATGGFQPGALWVVAGRPRMGKTILATGFARRVASRGARGPEAESPGYGAQLFSLEVTEDQIIARILADLAYTARRPVTYGHIMRGDLNAADFEAIEMAKQRLGTLPLALDVAPSLSVAEIGARVRAEKARMAKQDVRLPVVFIDYLKFIRASDRYRGNRVYEVGEITKGLKQLAKSEKVCVVLLAQVNRAVEGRDRRDKAPGLADLRESGDLEADSDVVVFIHRESVYVKQTPEYRAGDPETVDRFLDLEHKADLIVAKTRVGSERTIPIWFDAGASTFSAQAREGLS